MAYVLTFKTSLTNRTRKAKYLLRSMSFPLSALLRTAGAAARARYNRVYRTTAVHRFKYPKPD
mgnify:FL=1